MDLRTKLSGLSLGIGIVIGLALGYGTSHGRHFMHRPPGDPFRGKDLTEDEQRKVHELAKSALEEDRPRLEKLEELTRALREKLRSADAKTEDLRRDFATINDLRREMAERRFDLDLKVRDLVGPDRLHGFDPLGPPPGPHGPHGPHGPPPPPPPEPREIPRDEK